MAKLSERALEARGVPDPVPEDDLSKWEEDRKKPAVVKIDYREGEPAIPPEAFVEAGWTADPGTGKAVLTEWGSEVLNPVPMAPPIGYVQGPSLMELMSQMLDKRLTMLREDDEIDTVEDLEDFGEDVDEFPTSPYEFIDMREDFPGNETGPENPPAPCVATSSEVPSGSPPQEASEAGRSSK